MPPSRDRQPSFLSFIGIVDFSEQALWIYCTDSVTDLLGWEPKEIRGTPSLDYVHPEEIETVRQMHYDTICADKAAALAYMRMKHKDPYKGYILCGVSRTIVQNVVVGSVGFASPGAKTMHNNATAQEVKIITPSAKHLEYRRWGDPSPMRSSPNWGHSPAASLVGDSLIRHRVTYNTPAEQSVRTAFILERFSLGCTILFTSNDGLIDRNVAIGRDFFDFVLPKDEDLVNSWLTAVKGWGVNEKGEPGSGGFGYGQFTLLRTPRDSRERIPEPASSRSRRGAQPILRNSMSAAHSPMNGSRPRTRVLSRTEPIPENEKLRVDGIFAAFSDGMLVILRPIEL